MTPAMAWLAPKREAARRLWLCATKTLKLRANRPAAMLLEIAFPLVVFVALSVLSPRNEYFGQAYVPGSDLIPPACVLHFDVPDVPALDDDAMPPKEPGTRVTPEVCPGAGVLAGPHARVHFAPDLPAVRALMRAACELRYTSPGVELANDGWFAHPNTALGAWMEAALEDDAASHGNASSYPSDDRRRRRRHLLFGRDDPPPAPPSPPSPPAPPAWPACSPVGHADEAALVAAATAEADRRDDADDDGGFAEALAVVFEGFEEGAAAAGSSGVGGAPLPTSYVIRAHADRETATLELQERLSDAYAAAAEFGLNADAPESTLAGSRSLFAIATLHRSFPLDPVYPTSTYGFIAKFLPLAVVVSWTYTLVACSSNVAGERELGLEAAMRAMGVPTWTHWAGHWLAAMTLLGVAAMFCGATMTSFGASIFTAGDPGLLFLLLFLAAAAATSGCFLAAAAAPDAAVAAAATAVAWLVTYLPFAVVASPASNFDVASGVPAVAIALACASPSAAQGLGFAAMAQWEAAGEGATWENLWRAPPANAAGDAGVPLGAAMLILFLDALGLVVLALYVDGRRFRRPDDRSDHSVEAERDDRGGSGAAKTRRDQSVVALEAVGLTREYRGDGSRPPHVALDGLDLHCPAGEITVLLGHNGAGKSSAIGCLVGAAAPTRGRALIGGSDAASPEARRRLGFCPQKDALWDDLTVQDHVDLVLRLRGVWDRASLEAQRKALLREVELRAKRSVRAGALSGGMRRRLSVALAFAGDPTHVILDEPTAGVDPRARRQIQNLLARKAKGRAVLVTTHHLDEAERLGARVAVLHRGRLACAGRAAELKRRYDVGYTLVCTLAEEDEDDPRDEGEDRRRHSPESSSSSSRHADARRDRLASAILATLENAGVANARRRGAEGKGEVSVDVPGSSAGKLPSALRALRADAKKLAVAGFGLAAPSLDGVFRAVTAAMAREDAGGENENDAAEGATARRESGEVVVEVGVAGANEAKAGEPRRRRERTRGGARGGAGWFHAAREVARAKLMDFYRDRSRLLVAFVAPTALTLVAAAIGKFPTYAREYAAAPHLPATAPGPFLGAPVPVFACAAGSGPAGAGPAGASVAPSWATLESAFDAGGASLAWLPPAPRPENALLPARPADRCFAEAAVWAEAKRLYPTGLRPREALGTAALALGAGSRANASEAGAARDADAATAWWATVPAARAAVALVASAEVDAAYSRGGGGSASASAWATLVDAARRGVTSGATRPWRKTRLALRRATLASSPGPAAAAAAALLAASVPPSLAAAAAAAERASGVRRVLLVAGMPRSAHWLGTVAADVLGVSVPSALLGAAAFAVAGTDALGARGVAAAAGLLAAHALAALAQAHLVALAFCADGRAALPACLLASALPASLFVGLNYAFDALGALELVPLASGVGRAFPGFALAQGVVDLALQHAAGAEYVVPSGGATVASLALAAACVGGACCALIAVADASAGVRAVAEECFSSEAEIRRLTEKGPAPDEDVLEEERRVREDDRREEGERRGVGARGDDGDATSPPRSKNGGVSSSPRDAVRLMGLQKMYLGKTTPAVRDLWLGVAPGECFGLLGINGCGKTTTFRIAAGDLPPTRGRVSIAAGAGGVGYCPQRDAVFPALTVVEHLRLARAARNAARTRDSADVYDGDVDDRDARDASFTDSVGAAILDAGLERFADVPAGHLSGGNKRKLCLAMSLLGLEKGGLALLDEPTAGVDPGARDAITRAVRAAANARRCAVVVTSHSIEDAAALCQRVGVMVDGALLCVGAPQRLRTKHGKRLTLVAHPKAPEANALPRTDRRRSSSDRDDPDAVAARVEAIVRGVVPGAKRVGVGGGGGGGGGGVEEAAAAAASSASDSATASEAAARAKALARIESDATGSSLTWELPASAAGAIPETLEALERETGPDGVLEGFAVGQASLEDVFLEFAAMGAEQSDAQLMALEDALFAYRKGLSSRAAGEPAEKER